MKRNSKGNQNVIVDEEDVHLLLEHAITTCLRVMSMWPSHAHVKSPALAGGKTDANRPAALVES